MLYLTPCQFTSLSNTIMATLFWQFLRSFIILSHTLLRNIIRFTCFSAAMLCSYWHPVSICNKKLRAVKLPWRHMSVQIIAPCSSLTNTSSTGNSEAPLLKSTQEYRIKRRGSYLYLGYESKHRLAEKLFCMYIWRYRISRHLWAATYMEETLNPASDRPSRSTELADMPRLKPYLV